MFVSVTLPQLDLRAALGETQNRLQEPIALGPQHDFAQRIGEVSDPARRLGVRPGMGLGEAIDICPELRLINPDPNRSEEIWQAFMTRIEAAGAQVESGRHGEAFFLAGPLERLHGGLDGVLEAVTARLGPSVLIGAGPSRLAALAAAHNQTRDRSPDRFRVVRPEELQACLDPLPVATLIGRLDGPEQSVRRMTSSLTRLGIHRLGQLRELSRDAIADRFGELGIEALEMATGVEPSIRPRTPLEQIAESLELPEVASGIHLQGALTILCDRLAARLAGLGMSVRSLSLEARLSGGGSWAREAAPREPTGRSDLLRMLLAPGLDQLPRPAEQLGLRVTEMTGSAPKQIELSNRPGETRRLRLSEAAHQVRAAVGEAALMRVLDAEAGSHLPERRMLLTPYLTR
jgi:nucleotidyltransferase/DNA polymerase involved in DNA repair